MGLNKKQKPNGAQDPFDKVLSLALEYLENGVQDEPGSEVQDEPGSEL